MIHLLQSRSAEIAELCRPFHVKRLDVFGSAAREHDFSDKSDIDLIVEFDPDMGPPRFDDFLALREALTKVIGRDVDLMMAGPIENPYLRASIERSRQILHGA